MIQKKKDRIVQNLIETLIHNILYPNEMIFIAITTSTLIPLIIGRKEKKMAKITIIMIVAKESKGNNAEDMIIAIGLKMLIIVPSIQQIKYLPYMKPKPRIKRMRYIRIHSIGIESMKGSIWCKLSNNKKNLEDNYWLKFLKISLAVMEWNDPTKLLYLYC